MFLFSNKFTILSEIFCFIYESSRSSSFFVAFTQHRTVKYCNVYWPLLNIGLLKYCNVYWPLLNGGLLKYCNVYWPLLNGGLLKYCNVYWPLLNGRPLFKYLKLIELTNLKANEFSRRIILTD